MACIFYVRLANPCVHFCQFGFLVLVCASSYRVGKTSWFFFSSLQVKMSVDIVQFVSAKDVLLRVRGAFGTKIMF